MSVKIRLRRMGKKKQPHYRIVVTDTRAPRDGRFVEILGYYNPIKHPAALRVDLERVEYWVGRGAILSPTVGSLVSKARAGGDDTVALVGAGADGDASAAASAANGASAEAASDAGDSAEVEAAADDADADEPAAADDPDADAPGAADDAEEAAAAVAEAADAAQTDVAEDPAAEAAKAPPPRNPRTPTTRPTTTRPQPRKPPRPPPPRNPRTRPKRPQPTLKTAKRKLPTTETPELDRGRPSPLPRGGSPQQGPRDEGRTLHLAADGLPRKPLHSPGPCTFPATKTARTRRPPCPN